MTEVMAKLMIIYVDQSIFEFTATTTTQKFES